MDFIVHKIRLSPQIQRKLSSRKQDYFLHSCHESDVFYVSNYSLENLKRSRISFEGLKSWTQAELPLQVSYPSHAAFFDPPHSDALEEVLAYALAKKNGERKLQILYHGRSDRRPLNSFALDRPGGGRKYLWEILETPRKVRDIRGMFPKISAKIRDPKTKVIVSLGSGGIRLFAHPSLLKFFDLLELRPYLEEIWGSSGGSIAGLPYSLGVDPSVIEQEGYHLYNNRYSLRFSPSKLEVIKNLFTEAVLPNSDQMLKGFMDCQTALKELLEKHLTELKTRIPFYCIAYNLTERRGEVLTPENVDSGRYRTPILKTDPLDAVIASSAIPILYVPKVISRKGKDHLYIDGGTIEEVPLISPYRKWIRDKLSGREKRKKLLLISVNLFPQVGTSKLFTHWIFKKIPAFRLLQLSATYADMVRQARIDEQKGHLLRDKNVTLWDLHLPMSGTGIINMKIIPQVITTAQHSFFEQLLKIERSLKRRSLRESS